MEYKTNLATKISRFNLENKFYIRDIARGHNYYKANHIKYFFSPKKEKIIVVFDKNEYSILFLQNNILKFECSCRDRGVCEHYIPSILYLKENCEKLDELCSVDDMSYDIVNMNAEELYNYLSRIIGPRYLLIDSLADDFECNAEKMLSKIISQKSESDLYYKAIVMLASINNKPLKLNYYKKIFDLINSMRNFSWDYNINGFSYIASKDVLIKVINGLANNSAEEDYIDVLNFLIDIVKELKLEEGYEVALIAKLDYLLLHEKNEEFKDICLCNIHIKRIKMKYMNVQMKNKMYDDIINIYHNDKDEEIRELYYEALINAKPNEKTANEIIKSGPSLNILKILYKKNLIKDKSMLNALISNYSITERCEIYEAIADYENLLDEASCMGFSEVMKYSRTLFENYKEAFIPYFEKKIYTYVRSRSVKDVIKYLRMINSYKFGGYYVEMFLKYIFEEYIPYDDRYKYECFESELNI